MRKGLKLNSCARARLQVTTPTVHAVQHAPLKRCGFEEDRRAKRRSGCMKAVIHFVLPAPEYEVPQEYIPPILPLPQETVLCRLVFSPLDCADVHWSI